MAALSLIKLHVSMNFLDSPPTGILKHTCVYVLVSVRSCSINKAMNVLAIFIHLYALTYDKTNLLSSIQCK